MADSLGKGVNLNRANTMASAVFGSGVPPLAELEKSFHGTDQEVQVAYAASRDFVTYLRFHDADSNQFKQLLTHLRSGKGFNAAVLDAYGVTLNELEEEWRGGLFGRFVWSPLVSDGSIPFLLTVPAVAQDEARHAALAWSTLRWALERDPSLAVDLQRALEEACHERDAVPICHVLVESLVS